MQSALTHRANPDLLTRSQGTVLRHEWPGEKRSRNRAPDYYITCSLHIHTEDTEGTVSRVSAASEHTPRCRFTDTGLHCRTSLPRAPLPGTTGAALPGPWSHGPGPGRQVGAHFKRKEPHSCPLREEERSSCPCPHQDQQLARGPWSQRVPYSPRVPKEPVAEAS